MERKFSHQIVEPSLKDPLSDTVGKELITKERMPEEGVVVFEIISKEFDDSSFWQAILKHSSNN